MKNNKAITKILSFLLALTLIFTVPAGTAFAAGCNHTMPTGNSGKWVKDKNAVKAYVSEVMKYWADKEESGEITWVEYVEACPYGYQAWNCANCRMWTIDFYYEEKTCNHKWTAETTVYEPTCLGNGYRERTCTKCGKEDKRNLPELGHCVNQTVIEATTTTEGFVHSECARCGFVFGEYTTPKTIDMSLIKFTDLAGYNAYSGYVAYTSVFNSFITGTNPPERTLFSPKDSITRAMFITILYRMAGSPYDNGRNPYTKNPFSDVPSNAYYYNPACWALKNSITTQTLFKPYDSVTRQQTAAFLFRYAKENGLIKDNEYQNINLSQYPDYYANGSIIDGKPEPDYYAGVAEWAAEPLQWANYNGMITGTLQGYLNPLGATQRIHATKILYGFGKSCDVGNFE